MIILDFIFFIGMFLSLVILPSLIFNSRDWEIEEELRAEKMKSHH